MRRQPVLFPFLFAAYPVLFLLAANTGQIQLREAIQPLLIILVFSTLFLLLFRALTKDWDKAGLEVPLLLLLFFSYSHVYNFLSIQGLIQRDHTPLAIVLAITLISGVWRIWRLPQKTTSETTVLNTIAAILLIIPVAQVVIFQLRSPGIRHSNNKAESGNASYTDLSPRDSIPDIYYINS